jgi:peroxiredoxin
MSVTNKLKAGSIFPKLKVAKVGGEEVRLGIPQGSNDWQLVVVYRGKHCPLCTRYLTQLESIKERLYNIGIDLVAVSADSEEQAKEHLEKMKLSYPVAFGLSVDQMEQLGLYISNPRSPQETDHLFAEPGMFVVNDKGEVQVIDISNGPFARPELETLASGLEFIRNPANNYPIRGTYLY